MAAVVNDVAGRLASAAIQVCGLLGSLEDDLSDLKRNFERIQANLHDAEKNQPKNESDLKFLKSASLEAENVLDEANTEDMIQRMHGEMGRKYMLRTFFTSHNPLMVRFKIALKLKNIRKKLDKINAEKIGLTASTSKDEAGSGGGILERETFSHKPLVIYGRDEEKNMIVDKICNQEICIRHGDNFVRAYAIWGMGGIGKTTLAQLVYNDEAVKKHFELKCWVYVSSVFDVKQIIKKICGLEDKKLDTMSLGDLLGQLQNKLEGNKYLIIMDDVWIENKDMNEWEKLCVALKCGAEGSTVMVTTRNKDTAQLMANNIPELQHKVAVLSADESWSLFKMLAFPGGRDQGENVGELERVGRQIVEKCNGLPLEVKTLGSLMLNKNSVDQWQRVRDNYMWQIQDSKILPVLRISYHYLLPHWKRCFAYCCLFSKGEEMSKDLLIELWMANGFIPSQGDASLYELGEEIFDVLVGRSFFQDVVGKDIDTGTISKMHDLMHDLAQYVMKHDCAVIEPGKESRTPDEVLHLSLSCEDFEFLKQDLKKLRSVRSMLVFNRYYMSNIRQISSHVYLRVLYLNNIKSSTLPESICKLIHLRYLKISYSEIEVLLESIIYLQNLQTLILEECDSFRELPKGLRYMRNLQRLDIDTSSFSLRRMPVGIKELTNLQRLSEFVVGKDGARIGELGNLNLLGMRKLTLSKLENVGGLRDAKSANLKDKTNLKSLQLKWSVGRFAETYDSVQLKWSVGRSAETYDSEEVVEGLEPNSGLQELTIIEYKGTVIPSWLVKLVNLTSIHFDHLEKCEQLPPLGKLPSLKRIKMWRMDSLKYFHDDDNATSKDQILFPNLQELHIFSCGSLVSLPNNFPKLQSLEIFYCGKLGSLPDDIQSFNDLNQITIWECEILSKRCKKEIGEDWPKISHIPHLDIN